MSAQHCRACGGRFELRWATSEQEFCSPTCQQQGRKVGLVTLKPWSDDELGHLIDLAHLSAREAGQELGRSAQSVQHKRRQIANGWTPARQRITEDERAVVRATPHLTAQQLADVLSTTKDRAAHLRSALRQAEGISFDDGSRKSPFEVGPRTLLAKTCLGCGLLLDRSWFARNGVKNWKPRCNRCHHEAHPAKTSTHQRDGGKSARATYAKLQSFTLERATRHREPWIGSDHIVLRDPDLTAFEKALQLGRTYAATRVAVKTNGYTSRVGKGDPMKGVWVIDNPNTPQVVAA